MERSFEAQHSRSRGRGVESAMEAKAGAARSRSPSPARTSASRHARTSASRHARRRSRSPLRSRYEPEDDQASPRSRRHHRQHHRCRKPDWDGENHEGQYSYRSSHHLDDLRARRRASSSRHRPSKDVTSGEISRNTHQHNQQSTEPGPQQVTTLSPTPSPPNEHAARFSSGPQRTYESSHRHLYLQEDHRSRSRSRSRSHQSSSRHQHRSRRRSSAHAYASQDGSGAIILPFGARTLSRWDFAAFEPLFAHYLELHKGLAINQLGEDEVAGRWKSFLSKWNTGELAEGWYEPEMFLRVVRLRAIEEQAQKAAASTGSGSDIDPSQILTPPMTGTSMTPSMGRSSLLGPDSAVTATFGDREDEGSEDEDYGPAPPPATKCQSEMTAPHQYQSSSTSVQGPAVPSLQDLAVRHELEDENRAGQVSDLRAARKADRALQKERLDELLPRAEPGTRERQLEKRKLLAETMRAFRDASPDREVGDQDLMGSGDGFDDYKRMLASLRQRKSAREVRQEEIARARNAEREERAQAYRDREESTMERLKEIARQRFGV